MLQKKWGKGISKDIPIDLFIEELPLLTGNRVFNQVVLNDILDVIIQTIGQSLLDKNKCSQKNKDDNIHESEALKR